MRGSLLWSNDRDIRKLWMLQLRYGYPCKKVSADIDNIRVNTEIDTMENRRNAWK